MKPGEDESIEKRGAPQHDVRELELKQPQPPDNGTQEASPDPEGETREAPPDPEKGAQEALRDPDKETRGAPSDPRQGTRQVPSDHKEETQEASSDFDEETREAPSDTDEETGEAPSSPEKETQEAPSDSEEETNDVAGLAAGSTDLEGLVVPARRKLNISGNLSQNNVITLVESTGARRRERSSGAKLSTDERGGR